MKKFDRSEFPFIQDSLTFRFSGATGLDLAELTSFRFFFGTNGNNLTETPEAPPRIAAIAPEPSTLGGAVAGSIGMLAYALLRRRTRSRA